VGAGADCSGRSRALCWENAGVIQLVECQLPKLDVAGSSPVARSCKSLECNALKAAPALVWGPLCVHLSSFQWPPAYFAWGPSARRCDDEYANCLHYDILRRLAAAARGPFDWRRRATVTGRL
jgi:hypothetical protein